MLVVDDWRLMDNGDIQPSFGNFHDAMMAGRLGQYITLNSQDTLDVPVKTNERLRLRIVNTANSRIFQFRIAQHAARVMAVDGQPCPPELAPNGLLRLAPGNRVDLFLDATLSPGSRAPIMVDDLRGGELEVGRLVYDAGPPLREKPLAEPKPLPANPLPGQARYRQRARSSTCRSMAAAWRMMMGRGGMHGRRHAWRPAALPRLRRAAAATHLGARRRRRRPAMTGRRCSRSSAAAR